MAVTAAIAVAVIGELHAKFVGAAFQDEAGAGTAIDGIGNGGLEAVDVGIEGGGIGLVLSEMMKALGAQDDEDFLTSDE